MKKLIVTLLALAMLAVPSMAASIDLVDNEDGTGTVRLTVESGEVVRGLAVVVTADTPITDVTKGDPIFNVFMDYAYVEETEGDGYTLGEGSPVADPENAGIIDLSTTVATEISLSMGVLDESGNQGGADETSSASSNNVYDVATIDLGCAAATATVTIESDDLRGGIVGDNVVVGTIAGGDITCDVGCGTCPGDLSGDNRLRTNDLGLMVSILSNAGPPYVVTVDPENPAHSCADLTGDNRIRINDLGTLVSILSNAGHPYIVPCN